MGFGSAILGKTCKYCARCEMIVVNKPEMDTQVGLITGRPGEEVDWLVLGTVDKRDWKRRLSEGPNTAVDIPEDLVRFKDFRPVAISACASSRLVP